MVEIAELGIEFYLWGCPQVRASSEETGGCVVARHDEFPRYRRE